MLLTAGTLRDLCSGRRAGPLASAFRGVTACCEPFVRWYVDRRNAAFDTGKRAVFHVPLPVISVGNLTVGGTGKSPFVAWLAEWFRARETPVTLISRGYGRRGSGPNDEARELALRLPDVPHLQNPDRVAAAQKAYADCEAQVLVLDDAFQHRRLARDLDIVLLDALDPFGCEHLLPRGLLREPIAGLRRAQVVALSRADAVRPAEREAIRQRVAQLAPEADWLEVVHRPHELWSFGGERRSVDALRGLTVAAFCGIGNPAGFRFTLERCGAKVIVLEEFPDHAPYHGEQLERLEAKVRRYSTPEAVICTGKDLVKIPRQTLAGLPLWGLGIALEIQEGEALLTRRLTEMRDRLPPRK